MPITNGAIQGLPIHAFTLEMKEGENPKFSITLKRKQCLTLSKAFSKTMLIIILFSFMDRLFHQYYVFHDLTLLNKTTLIIKDHTKEKGFDYVGKNLSKNLIRCVEKIIWLEMREG